ncbi:MerC domain-containing protein [Hymenobacter arizonensis]|uniref:MerC mercury resistance protein n=1 Tax=Hymenobacter arizonensis TaxID=1227077 RepID=A0A1I5Z6B1_HYMAR|nr:MerC domain-containing protein [Hymenobacter arizonensis]SFQ51657.1 MerC mercury resistance protein [Hymenobacter arizonensis]
MKSITIRRAADYGGVLNAVLCGVHCAAGPLLLAWWGTRNPESTSESWELGFLALSGLLVALATRRQSTPSLRMALWGMFAVFAACSLLAERWPLLELAQYAASAGLIVVHLLNERHCRNCACRSSLGCISGQRS